MLKLTKTGIGLLTRQYRSVLHKCFLINNGIWNWVMRTGAAGATAAAIAGAATMLTPSEAMADNGVICATSSGSVVFRDGSSSCNSGESLIGFTGTNNNVTQTQYGLLGWDNYAYAAAGYIFGRSNELYSTATGATAIGLSNIVKGYSSVAVGRYNNAYGNYSVVLGDHSKAGLSTSNTNSIANIAIGNYAYATGDKAISLGYYSEASAVSSVAIGNGAKATDNETIAIGNDALASDNYAIAIGDEAKAAYWGVAIGLSARANGEDAGTAVGESANAYAEFSSAFGAATTTYGTRSVAIGASSNTTSDANYSVALGAYSVAKDSYTISVGSGRSGDAYATRKIVNVTAGTADTDAVNVKQMTDAIAAAGGGGNYSAGTGIDITNDVISLDSTYLGNNYYTKLGKTESVRVANDSEEKDCHHCGKMPDQVGHDRKAVRMTVPYSAFFNFLQKTLDFCQNLRYDVLIF